MSRIATGIYRCEQWEFHQWIQMSKSHEVHHNSDNSTVLIHPVVWRVYSTAQQHNGRMRSAHVLSDLKSWFWENHKQISLQLQLWAPLAPQVCKMSAASNCSSCSLHPVWSSSAQHIKDSMSRWSLMSNRPSTLQAYEYPNQTLALWFILQTMIAIISSSYSSLLTRSFVLLQTFHRCKFISKWLEEAKEAKCRRRRGCC